MMEADRLFNAFRKIKVGVIGDVMLDTYMWGKVERISPEAPVPIVAVERRENRLGGASNVALNLASLGAQTTLLSVTGDDADGKILSSLLHEKGIEGKYLIGSSSRVTTNKTRIISRNQQMFRLDTEVIRDLDETETRKLMKSIESFIQEEKPDVMLFEDYDKGVLTDEVISRTIALCIDRGILTAVDPKRKSFFSYKGVDIFKPNLKEVRDALHLTSEEVSRRSMAIIHEQLQTQLHHLISLITLSEKGVYYQTGMESAVIPSHVRNIADVSGAGDTVIAVASLVYAVTRDARLMAEVANLAGGLVCEEVGTAAINPDRLQQEMKQLLG
jgi:rfaE bifunctional protein kinase chain/domain